MYAAIHELLQYRAEAPTLGRVANRRQLAEQAQLSQQTQAVVRQHAQMQDGIVGVEFARRQAFQVQVGLELGMELFLLAVIAVESDHLGFRIHQAGPPVFQFDVRQQQQLSVLVDRALDQTGNQAKVPGVFSESPFDDERE